MPTRTKKGASSRACRVGRDDGGCNDDGSTWGREGARRGRVGASRARSSRARAGASRSRAHRASSRGFRVQDVEHRLEDLVREVVPPREPVAGVRSGATRASPSRAARARRVAPSLTESSACGTPSEGAEAGAPGGGGGGDDMTRGGRATRCARARRSAKHSTKEGRRLHVSAVASRFLRPLRLVSRLDVDAAARALASPRARVRARPPERGGRCGRSRVARSRPRLARPRAPRRPRPPRDRAPRRVGTRGASCLRAPPPVLRGAPPPPPLARSYFAGHPQIRNAEGQDMAQVRAGVRLRKALCAVMSHPSMAHRFEPVGVVILEVRMARDFKLAHVRYVVADDAPDDALDDSDDARRLHLRRKAAAILRANAARLRNMAGKMLRAKHTPRLGIRRRRRGDPRGARVERRVPARRGGGEGA